MKILSAKIIILGLLAAAVAISPIVANAQDASTNTPAKPKAKKSEHLVFNGKVTDIDTNTLTLVVGKRTFEITSETNITKDGKPSNLSGGVVGEAVAGSYKQGADGKMTATSIHFGAKTKDAKSKEGKKKNKQASSESLENVTNSMVN